MSDTVLLVGAELETRAWAQALGPQFDCWFAATAQDAFEAMAERHVVAVVTAAALKDTSGLVVLEEAASKPLPRPVTMVVGELDDAQRAAAYAAGGDDVVPATITATELKARLGRRLASRAETATLRSAFEALSDRAVFDAATGLANERELEARLAHEFARTVRADDPAALLVVDIDQAQAELPGEVVVRAIADAVRSAVRETDFVARAGAVAFAILLPKTQLAGALAVAERITHAARKTNSNGAPVSVSIGIARHPMKGLNSHVELLGAAKQALVAAKADRRTKISVWQPH